jgi:hypothetical protein
MILRISDNKNKFKIMKRLILFIAIMTLTSALFAQLSGLLDYIQKRPAYEFNERPFAGKFGEDGRGGRYIYTLTPQKFQQMIDSTTWMKDYLSTKTYSFFKDNKFYMLSYDTCSTCSKNPRVDKPIRRGLYLFCLDNGKWTKVSDALQTDYFSLDLDTWKPNTIEHIIWSSYCYFPWRTAGDLSNDKGEFGEGVKDGSVTVSANGDVTIVLVNHKMYDDDNKYGIKRSFENRTVVLEFNSKFYTVKK